jgi:plastocyanin
MVCLRFAALLGITGSLICIAHGQATVTVYVGYNGMQAFHDVASNTTSSFDTTNNTSKPSVTSIHEGDTVKFEWQGSLHNITPYDTGNNSSGFTTSKDSTQLTGSSTWSGANRRTTYQCTLHPTRMNGEINVYEVVRRFVVALPPPAPARVAAGSTFEITVTAAGQNGTADWLYLGTIRFSSSDSAPGVVLPADYTFVAGDKGVHKFAGLVLKTVNAAATITVNATAGGLTGLATLRVESAPNAPPECSGKPLKRVPGELVPLHGYTR